MNKQQKPRKPVKKDAAWHIQQGLIWVGFVGAIASCLVIKLVQSAVDSNHPLNQKFQDAPIWIPGGFLIAGPLLGLAYYAIFVKGAEK